MLTIPERLVRGGVVALTVCVVFGATAGGAQARPRIAALHAGLTGVGETGASYEVIVSTRLRACAQRGRLVVRVREQNTGFDDPPTLVAERYRKFFLRQTARCQTHAIRWKLGDAFFGIGVYRLRYQLVDRDGAFSRSAFRHFETYD
jgi:hypothetical protein